MSSDDVIIVREVEGGYHVYHSEAEGGTIEDIGVIKDLRDAMIKAEEYQSEQEYGVEYGIRFFPLSKEPTIEI